MPTIEGTLLSLQRQITALAGRVDKLEGLAVPPPVEPPPPPPPPKDAYDYDLDMRVSRNVDVKVKEGQTVVFRFRFTETMGESITRFTAVDLVNGPCFKMRLRDWDYSHHFCRHEISHAVATNSQHTQWVVPKGEYIYLEVINEAGPGTLRLHWMRETVYL